MSFFNEKWNNSSILTKVALFTMLLNSLLLLIIALIINSWTKALLSLAGSGETISAFSNPYVIAFLILFFYNVLLSFGIFKVNGIARFFTILEGLGSVLCIVFFIAGYRYTIAYAREAVTAAAGETAVGAVEAANAASAGIIGKIMPSLLAMIPPNILTKIGLYLIIFIGPFILQLLSMLILFFCGKDFKKIKKGEIQPIS
jgi:hypothetical protein